MMESDDNDGVHSDDEDWSLPVDDYVAHGSLDRTVSNKNMGNIGKQLGGVAVLPGDNFPVSKLGHQRTIVHIDIDCFYAQVEMIRNPRLRNKPIGVQQKSLMVTCNYVARSRGVTKLMGLKEAKETCPDIIMVCGEDLTHYRNMSYKISEHLRQFSPLVERLGFDENYIDVTEMVARRLAETSPGSSPGVTGWMYGVEDVESGQGVDCSCGCVRRLTVGSQIASEIRESLHQALGITGCAGVAHNKLLSKLVAGTHKPNQQTTLFPWQATKLLALLPHATSIPGIGHATGKKLASAGIHSIQDVQDSEMSTLVAECGAVQARLIKQLSHGVDDSPVTPYGRPQTISDEDSFRRCSSISQAQEKIEELLSNLLHRCVGCDEDLTVRHILLDCVDFAAQRAGFYSSPNLKHLFTQDGRVPHTIRLSIRRQDGTQYLNRESKQCPISGLLLQRLGKNVLGCHGDLLRVALTLLEKLVEGLRTFNLTLINVAFAKLEEKASTDITSFFKSRSPPDKTRTDDQTTCVEPDTGGHNKLSGVGVSNRGVWTGERSAPQHESPVKRNSKDVKSVDSRTESAENKTKAKVNVSPCKKLADITASNCQMHDRLPDSGFSKGMLLDKDTVVAELGYTSEHPLSENDCKGQNKSLAEAGNVGAINSASSTVVCDDSETRIVMGSSVESASTTSTSPSLSCKSAHDIGSVVLNQSEVHSASSVSACFRSPRLQQNLPAGIDPEVFRLLPPSIQRDILEDVLTTRGGPGRSPYTSQSTAWRRKRRRGGEDMDPVVCPFSEAPPGGQDVGGSVVGIEQKVTQASSEGSTMCDNKLKSPAVQEGDQLPPGDDTSPFQKKKKLFYSRQVLLQDTDPNNNRPPCYDLLDQSDQKPTDMFVSDAFQYSVSEMDSSKETIDAVVELLTSPTELKCEMNSSRYTKQSTDLNISQPSTTRSIDTTSSSISPPLSAPTVSMTFTCSSSSTSSASNPPPSPAKTSTFSMSQLSPDINSTPSTNTATDSAHILIPISDSPSELVAASKSDFSDITTSELSQHPEMVKYFPIEIDRVLEPTPESAHSPKVPHSQESRKSPELSDTQESTDSTELSHIQEFTHSSHIQEYTHLPQISHITESTNSPLSRIQESTHSPQMLHMPLTNRNIESAYSPRTSNTPESAYPPPATMPGSVSPSLPRFRCITGPPPPVPPHMDSEVFRCLPVEIQVELSLQWEFRNRPSTALTSSSSSYSTPTLSQRSAANKKSSKIAVKQTKQVKKATTLLKFFRSVNNK